MRYVKKDKKVCLCIDCSNDILTFAPQTVCGKTVVTSEYLSLNNCIDNKLLETVDCNDCIQALKTVNLSTLSTKERHTILPIMHKIAKKWK